MMTWFEGAWLALVWTPVLAPFLAWFRCCVWRPFESLVVNRTPTSRTGVASAVAIAIPALVMMGEIARLIGDSLTSAGEVGSLGKVLGPSSLSGGAQHTWSVWAQVRDPAQVGRWMATHAAVDLFFVFGYAKALLWVTRGAKLAQRLVAVLVALEVIESALLFVAGQSLGSGRPWAGLTWALAAVTLAKWLSVAAVLLAVARINMLRDRLLSSLWRLIQALKYQRLSTVPAILLGVLSTIPGANIFDQLPDVERGWADDPGGAGHFLVGVCAIVLVAWLLHHLGRQRYARAVLTRAYGTAPTRPPGRALWLVGPAVVLAGAVGLGALGASNTRDWLLVWLFVGTPALLVLGSWLVHVVRADSPLDEEASVLTGSAELPDDSLLWGEASEIARLRRERSWQPDMPFADAVARAGDGLAISLVWILGVGLVRSFTAPVLSPTAHAPVGWERTLFVIGVGVSLLAFPVGVRVLRLLRPRTPPALGTTETVLHGWRLVLLGMVGLASNLALALLPFALTDFYGVVGTVVLALGGWVALLGSIVVYLQDRRPLEVFRVFHMRANPLLSLFFVVPMLLTVLPSNPSLHYVRTLDGMQGDNRPTLATVFTSWLGKDACKVRTEDGAWIRPMLLVAASGGGIRAAYWTDAFEQRLVDVGGCAPRMTLLSSGVSGGSLGLAVSTRAPMAPKQAARDLSRPNALSVALEGTVIGDLAGGSSGVRVPVIRHGDHPSRWLDRAGLMERAWEDSVPGLADKWSAWTPDQNGPAGALVLNSTAVGYGCRVLVSQVRLRLDDHADTRPNCVALSGEPAAAIDLLDVYGDCLPALSWTTAAMLSARFPTVTPAGRIPLTQACKGKHPDSDLMLVDGGYAESSGVATIADIAGQVVGLVRDHNTTVDGSEARPYVMPLVAYLEDEVRSDVLLAAPKKPAEAFVPLVGRGAKKQQVSTGAQLQRVSEFFADPCPHKDVAQSTACDVASRRLRSHLSDGVLFVGPSTEPGVNAPLGWTLSGDSRQRLDDAMDEQADRGARPTSSPTCKPQTTGYYGLAALLALVDGHLGCNG